jgi:hypothetical protein
MSNTRKCHISLPVLVGEGKLILDAGTAHPDISTHLPANYLTDTTVVWGKVKAQGVDQKTKRAQTGTLSQAQLDEIHTFHKLVSDARETAKLAFVGQDVKLREQFQVGIHKPHDLQSQLQRGRTVVGGLEAAENQAGLTARGWTAAETTALDQLITKMENDKSLLEAAKDAGIGSTGQKNTLADDLNDRLVTIQNAVNRKWPESDPANAQTRLDFRLGKFPPKDHSGHHVDPTPAPATAPAMK